jgi:adenylate kinase family enzyme
VFCFFLKRKNTLRKPDMTAPVTSGFLFEKKKKTPYAHPTKNNFFILGVCRIKSSKLCVERQPSNKSTLQPNPMHIHLMGAPGAGVTTLGAQLARQREVPHFDADDYHWFTTDPEPYRRRRNPAHRMALLTADLDAATSGWVLTGSVCGWGDALVPRMDAVVWCWLPAELRLARIGARELARYGATRLGEGGDLAGVFQKFQDWAAAYDAPDATHLRSKTAELAWLGGLSCPVLHLTDDDSVAANAARIEAWIQSWASRV